MTDSAYTFALEETPLPDDVQAVHRGLQAYNQERAPTGPYVPLTILLRDAHGAVAGGLLGGMHWGWLHVDILWLREDARRQGFGKRLLALAEDEARRHGCRHVFLDTLSFQALPFYQKQGYSVWGELDDFPTGHTRHFLKKAL